MATGSPPSGPLEADLVLGNLAGDARLARALALGVPAFMRRAKGLEDLVERLHAEIRAERSRRLLSLLVTARRLWASRQAGAALPPGALAVLQVLREEPRFASRSAPASRSAGRDLRDLERRARRFNLSWTSYLEAAPIEPVRRAQADYNRYYPIEREMALHVPPRVPFREIPLLERRDLLTRFPPLPAVEGTAP